MIIQIFDFETNSVNVETTHITEMGWALVDLSKKKILTMKSHLISPKEKFEITDEVEHLTGIDYKMLTNYGKNFGLVLDEFYNDLFPFIDDQPEFLCGHNIKKFDKPILDRYVDEYSQDKFMPEEFFKIKEVPLLDTMTDLPIPDEIRTRKLTHLCFEYGIIMRPAHRALVDVMMCAQLLFQFDLNEVLAYMSQADVELIARIGGPWEEGFQERKQKIVGYGFRWQPQNKTWSMVTKEVRAKKILNEISEFEIEAQTL